MAILSVAVFFIVVACDCCWHLMICLTSLHFHRRKFGCLIPSFETLNIWRTITFFCRVSLYFLSFDHFKSMTWNSNGFFSFANFTEHRSNWIDLNFFKAFSFWTFLDFFIMNFMVIQWLYKIMFPSLWFQKALS